MSTKYRVHFETGYTEFTFLLDAQNFANSINVSFENIEIIEFTSIDENNSPLKISNDYGISKVEVIDYDILGYHKERIFVEGELIQVNYYRFQDETTKVFSDKVIEENRSFFRSATGLPIKRFLTTRWFRENNTVGYEILNRPKYYSSIDSLEELVIRRKNVITQAKKIIYETLLVNNSYDEVLTLTQSKQILNSIGTNNILNYLEGDGNGLNTALDNITFEFYTSALRTAVYNILNYQYLEQNIS